ncbi:hypothetical protein KKG83_03905 [Candidatus Micrarchaeota archaeon]|nr:hypothetical protein [Candidatus Micrarchaeota archaeon]MBU2476589.1 hypothetical protein [Candidatus Micrarchaeota archaeon]
MQSLIEVLKNSFFVLKKEPKLFFPKIFLSVLWGVFLLFYAGFTRVLLDKVSASSFDSLYLNELLPTFYLLLVFFVVVFVIDTIINSAYPLMVGKYLKKENFSVFGSIKTVTENFWKIFIPVAVSLFAGIVVLLPFILLFSFFILQKNFFPALILGFIVLCISILVSVLFYFIYPVASIERKGLKSVVSAVVRAKNNLKKALFGTLVFSFLSIISALIVFFSEADAAGVFAVTIFVALRIITAVLATYSMVLNPLLYFSTGSELNEL